MAPKNRHHEQPAQQGQLFPVETSRLHPPIIGEVTGEGVFPEDMPATLEGAETQHLHEAIHEAVVAEQQTRNRRQGNLGKHSPLQRDGDYTRIQLGDYLPGFGAVKERNWEEAKAAARKLEADRTAKLRQQPDLLHDMIQELAEDKAIPETDEPAMLDTRAKLQALRDDRRAAFLPTTHVEKNQAVELLDYLPQTADEQAAKRGLHNRLQEIHDHQLRVFARQGHSLPVRKRLAYESVESVIQTYGDHLQDARRSYVGLSRLAALIDDTPNPKLTLAEVLADHGEPADGAHQLIRYMDMLMLREGSGANELPFDPLHAIENRKNPTETKNKIVEDPYTSQLQDEAVSRHLESMMATLQVGALRQVVLRAREDQAHRGMFWDYVLGHIGFSYRAAAEAAHHPATQ